MKNIIFIAPPAAGKGTQSKLVSEEYNIPHISTGDLLRDEVASGSVLGHFLKEEMDRGGLISDDTMVNLLRTRITQVDCNDGYILDGYPRNVEQARIYDNMIQELGKEIGIVIFIDIDRELALKRTMGRLVCSACGTSYNKNILELSPKIDGFCDKCGHTIQVRSDDCAETFTNRFDTYLEQTKPLIDYYKERGILREIKLEEQDSVQDVFSKIKSIIG
jgi:adenylate kinase